MDAPSILLIGRPLERAAQRTNAALHAPTLDVDLTSLVQMIGAAPSAPQGTEDPERRIAQ
jgi:hypothetical protein